MIFLPPTNGEYPDRLASNPYPPGLANRRTAFWKPGLGFRRQMSFGGAFQCPCRDLPMGRSHRQCLDFPGGKPMALPERRRGFEHGCLIYLQSDLIPGDGVANAGQGMQRVFGDIEPFGNFADWIGWPRRELELRKFPEPVIHVTSASLPEEPLAGPMQNGNGIAQPGGLDPRGKGREPFNRSARKRLTGVSNGALIAGRSTRRTDRRP